MAVSGQFLVAAVTPVLWAEEAADFVMPPTGRRHLLSHMAG
jgi:hypothetical protein